MKSCQYLASVFIKDGQWKFYHGRRLDSFDCASQSMWAETCPACTQSTRPQGRSAFRNPTGSWPDGRAHQAGAPFRASPSVLLQRLTRQASRGFSSRQSPALRSTTRLEIAVAVLQRRGGVRINRLPVCTAAAVGLSTGVVDPAPLVQDFRESHVGTSRSCGRTVEIVPALLDYGPVIATLLDFSTPSVRRSRRNRQRGSQQQCGGEKSR